MPAGRARRPADDAIADDRLRLIFTCCHPALAPRGAGRADAAAGVRPDHGRGGARVPGQRADDGGPDHPGEEEDRRGAHPVPGAAGGRAAGAGRRRADRRAPAVHDRPHRAGRATSWCAATWSSARSTWPGCCGALLPDDADVAGLLALMLLTDARRATRDRRRRPAAAARRAGPRAAGTAARSPRASRWCARRCARRPPGRFALQAAIAAVHAEAPTLGGHRLARDRRALRPARCRSGRRRSSRSTAPWRSASPTGRTPGWRRSTRWPASRSWPATATSPAARADFLRRLGRRRRGARGLRGGAAAHRERGRAGLPRRPAAGPRPRLNKQRRPSCKAEPGEQIGEQQPGSTRTAAGPAGLID